MEKFSNILELLDRFPNDQTCSKYLEGMIWKEGKPVCPHCRSDDKIYRYEKRSLFKCSSCKKQFTVTVGTIFQGTHVSLRKWFIALYLFTAHKKGISAHQLSRDISVTVKTAWFMLQRIRHAVQTQDFGAPLEGTVMVDETYVGMKQKNKHYNKRTKGQQGRGGTEKTSVFGMIQQGGKVKSMKVPDVKGETLKPIIYQYVKPGAVLMSDEWQAYNGLGKTFVHVQCDHARYQYVDQETGATTNAIENYWSGLKRTFHGTYHHVSRKHMDRYLAETDFRFNSRNDTTLHRFNTALIHTKGRLTYSQLIKG